VKLLDAQAYVEGVRGGDRALLARAITLIESEQPAHAELAQEVLGALLPETGGAYRVGISGVPGAGKSTFIDALGTMLTSWGHRVAVLAVDPTSSISGGSILGDKTRMSTLANDPKAEQAYLNMLHRVLEDAYDLVYSLGQRTAVDGKGQTQPHAGHHGKGRIGRRVAVSNGPFVKALGPGSDNVIVLQRV